MAADRNLESMREYHERWNRGDVEGVLAMFAVDTSNHGKAVGRGGLETSLRDIFTIFPDTHIDVLEMVASDDKVVVRCRYSGTHRGIGTSSVYGGYFRDAAPTQKVFDVQHTHWMTFRDGFIVEHQSSRDDLGMLVQLGLLPDADASRASGSTSA